jgi:vacuolar-type H+-ATPase subunit E/Vma4
MRLERRRLPGAAAAPAGPSPAEVQAEGILQRARAAADRTLAASAERLRRRRDELLGAREAELMVEAEGHLAAVRPQAERQVARARERAVARVMATVGERLAAAAAGEAYRRALPRYLAEALAFLGCEPAAVHCPPALVADVRRLLAARPQVTVVDGGPGSSGIRVVAADGSLEVDNTLEGRLQAMRPALDAELLSRLEAERGAD